MAQFIVSLVDWKDVSVLLEAGCGRGQLTMPLIRKARRKCRVIAFDLSAGPYAGDLEVLRNRVVDEGLENVIKTVEGDVRNMRAIADESVDLIVSNELFGELDRAGLEQALKEFNRVLKHGGQMVLSELSPAAENKAQELLIEANLHYSMDTMLPEGVYWLSPTVDDVATIMHKTGFGNIQARFFETNIRLGYEVAVEQLKKWRIDPRFMKKHREDLQRQGIEFPLEHVIVCEKK